MWRCVLLALAGAHVSVTHRALRHSHGAVEVLAIARRNDTANSTNSSNASPTPQPHVKELEDWTHNCPVPPCRDAKGRALMQPNEHGDWEGEISRRPYYAKNKLNGASYGVVFFVAALAARV